MSKTKVVACIKGSNMAKKEFKPVVIEEYCSGTEFVDMLERRIKEQGPEEMEMDDETKEKVKKLMAMGGFVVLGKEK